MMCRIPCKEICKEIWVFSVQKDVHVIVEMEYYYFVGESEREESSKNFNFCVFLCVS